MIRNNNNNSGHGNLGWIAATGASVACSVVSMSLAYSFWRKANGKGDETYDSKLTRQSSIQSLHGWSRVTGLIQLSYHDLLAIGTGCGALLLNHFKLTTEGTRHLLILAWCSGMVSSWSSQRQQAQTNSMMDHSPIQRSNELFEWWLLLYSYSILGPGFSSPKSDQSPMVVEKQRDMSWLVACFLGWQMWKKSRQEFGQPKGGDVLDRGDASANQATSGVVVDDDGASYTTDSKADNIPQQQQQQQQQNGPKLVLPSSLDKTEPRNNKQLLTETTHTTDSTETPTLSTSASKKRYLEILVHNVSHSDLVLSLDAKAHHSPVVAEDENHSSAPSQQSINSSKKIDGFCLCRPRFSFFDYFCRAILSNLTSNDTLISFPRYQRLLDNPRWAVLNDSVDITPIPTGLRLLSNNKSPVMADLSEVKVRDLDMADLGEVRIRGISHPNAHDSQGKKLPNGDGETDKDVPASSASKFPINYVLFPLLATLLPRWDSEILAKQYRSRAVKRVLILVTGVGTPRNWTHSADGNSTQVCADLMQHFVGLLDPGITVVKIFSTTNIFRYDENVKFVQQELMPVVNAYRDAHARGIPYPDEQASTTGGNHFNVEWRKSLSVSISFADGSHARTFAIQAGLRPYRPNYFHFWQLKTFWHECKIIDEDLDVYSFEDMEASPAVDIENLNDPQLKLVVDEMMKYKDKMVATLRNSDNDIRQFWLRKTQKPVIAVLLVQNEEGKSILYRGSNMEVSMPTGSLCAERNVIGTALADNPNLKREHLKMVAVLAVPPPPSEHFISGTYGAMGSGEDHGVHGGMMGMKRVTSTASLGGSITLAGSALDLNDYFSDRVSARKTSLGSDTDEGFATGSVSQLQQQSVSQIAHNPSFGVTTDVRDYDGEEAPFRTIALFPSTYTAANMNNNNKPFRPLEDEAVDLPTRNKKTSSGGKRRTLVVVQSSRDLNPLKPCGACNEWLKKIAECNPYFQVISFTDANCHGVYCSPCQE